MDRFPSNDIVSLVGTTPRYDLAESVGPDLTLAELLPHLPPGWDTLPLGYGTAAGGLPLREAIARAHGVSADEVVVTVGGMHALFLLAFVLCDRGDEAVAASPLFPLARNALAAVGAETRTLRLRFDEGYRLDADALERLLTPRTRLVSLASPQNPSGVAIAPEVLRDIATRLARIAPQAWLLVDDTYREAPYGGAAPAPSALEAGPRVVTVASLSKCHGAPGLRIGWAIVRDRALREALVTAKFNTVISCSPVDEMLARAVLERREAIVGVRRGRLADNRARVAAWVERHADRVEWVAPDAGALCCVRLKGDDAAVERFHAALPALDVRVAPGPWFGEERRVFRLGFGLLDGPELDQALARLAAALPG